MSTGTAAMPGLTAHRLPSIPRTSPYATPATLLKKFRERSGISSGRCAGVWGECLLGKEGGEGGSGVSLAVSVGASVPDIDLGGAFGLPDWETLYRSVAQDLEALGTPLVSSSPTCGYRSMFSFSGAEIDSLQAEDDCLAPRGPAGGGVAAGAPEFTKDSLNSPTLLAL